MRKMELDRSQQLAVELVCRAQFGIVTGGPGTGKTTILRTALDRLDGVEVALASPTGKAAKRLKEATGREASTIHRLLEFAPWGEQGSGFARHENNPLTQAIVVIDESSMLDVELAAALLRAVDPTRTRLILVGDKDQLPSVGPGRVFGDLIDSGDIEVARLDTVHRAAAKSWVCRNAPRVLSGDVPDLDTYPDFVFAQSESPDVARMNIVDYVTTVADGDCQVLSPQRTGRIGTDALNLELQSVLNPRRGDERGFGTPPIRPRDRVIQTVNDYALWVFNGEVGEVLSVDQESLTVRFDDRAVVYDFERARALRLAYALTVHKAQGSEWATVVVVCHSSHTHMLSRQLIYTAITRASQNVVLVGDMKGLRAALRNVAPARRNTSLVERLKGAA